MFRRPERWVVSMPGARGKGSCVTYVPACCLVGDCCPPWWDPNIHSLGRHREPGSQDPAQSFPLFCCVFTHVSVLLHSLPVLCLSSCFFSFLSLYFLLLLAISKTKSGYHTICSKMIKEIICFLNMGQYSYFLGSIATDNNNNICRAAALMGPVSASFVIGK